MITSIIAKGIPAIYGASSCIPGWVRQASTLLTLIVPITAFAFDARAVVVPSPDRWEYEIVCGERRVPGNRVVDSCVSVSVPALELINVIDVSERPNIPRVIIGRPLHSGYMRKMILRHQEITSFLVWPNIVIRSLVHGGDRRGIISAKLSKLNKDISNFCWRPAVVLDSYFKRCVPSISVFQARRKMGHRDVGALGFDVVFSRFERRIGGAFSLLDAAAGKFDLPNRHDAQDASKSGDEYRRQRSPDGRRESEDSFNISLGRRQFSRDEMVVIVGGLVAAAIAALMLCVANVWRRD